MKLSLSLAAVFSLILLASCETDNMALPDSSPVVSNLNPSGGKAGDTITITGANFSPQVSGNTVKFTDSTAHIISATGTTLVVIVPAGATTGKVSVTVNGKTGLSDNDFVITSQLPPLITGFTPSGGPVGTTVTITGAHFDATIAGNTVKFNNVTATVSSASTGQLVVTVPAGATTGKITVGVAALVTTSATDFTIQSVPSITVTSFAPGAGVTGDTVIITGTGFSTTAAQNGVTFGGNIAATVFEATDTRLKMKVPAGAVTGVLSVTVGASTAASATPFEVLKDFPRNGLVAWYPFNGNGDDASGHGFNLQLVGTYNQVADRFGLAGKAYYFNGGNSYAISSNQTDASVSQPLTVASWIKYDSLLSSTIFGKYDVSAGGYLFGLVSNGAIMLYQNAPNYVMTNAGVIPVNSAGQWIFIAATYDGTTVNFYKNGALVQSIPSTSGATATAGSMRVGLSGDGGTGPAAFKCSLDDVTVYNRVLSAAEIQQLYSQTISRK